MKIVVRDPAWGARRTRIEGQALASLLRTVWRCAKQSLCGLRGHAYVLKTQRKRMALHCPACGHETPGWDLSDPTPRVTAKPDRPRYLELLRRRG